MKRHAQLSSLFHQLLSNPNSNKRIQLSTKLLDLLKLINSDLQKFEGAYLCGAQYTLADIQIYPIIERIVLVLSTYRGFWIPPALTNLIDWYDTVSNRTAIRAATSNRSLESQNAYCYESITWKEYLIEVYECYAKQEVDLFRELNADRGSAGVNVYRETVEDEARDKKICENTKCQQGCVVM